MGQSTWGFSAQNPTLKNQNSRTYKMGKFDGKYIFESGENIEPCMKVLGFPEDMCSKMLDAKNKTTITILENSDGSFTYTVEYSLLPEMNFSNTYKIGETTKVEKPWPLVQTVTKTNEYTWNTRTVMGNNTMVSESVANNYGMTIRATIEGTALSFTEVFRRVSPTVTGFYVFDSEKGLASLIKIIMPKMDFADFEALKPNLAFRIVEQPGGLSIDERLGHAKKIMSIKFDEEYDYSEPSWNVDDKRVTTKVAPGCYKTVCKSKKDGTIWEFTMSYNDLGFSVSVKAGGLEASEFYKRVPDMEGTWRVVTQCGMENYLSALGVTGSKATEMITSTASDQFTIERQSEGKIKVVSNSKYFPQEVINKLGETYTLEMQGFGTIEGVMTELKDTILNVWKFGGKTIAITEKISGDFMVAEYVVDGHLGSTMKIIMTRN